MPSPRIAHFSLRPRLAPPSPRLALASLCGSATWTRGSSTRASRCSRTQPQPRVCSRRSSSRASSASALSICASSVPAYVSVRTHVRFARICVA
jgi:hypothetical protein